MMEGETQPRPESVSDLRKRFEGKGKPQSPAEFHASSRAIAARHNLAVRMAQVAEHKRQQKKSDVFQDPRLAGLSDSEHAEFLLSAVGNYQEKTKALQVALDGDVLVGDNEIDNLTVKELWRMLSEAGEDSTPRGKLSEMRMRALEIKKNKQNATTETNSLNLNFFAPELTQALNQGNDYDINRAILQMFFEEYDKSRLGDIDSLLEQHKGEEDELFAELAWKYPEHANKLVAFSINAAYGEPPAHPVASNHRRTSFMVSGF